MVRRQWLSRISGSGERAREALARAHRDLKAAAANLEIDYDWAYGIAYDAALQSSFGLMEAMGYRAGRRGGSHKTAVQFARVVLADEEELSTRPFEKMRRDRHRLVYEIAGTITERQARDAVQYAERFVGIVERHIEEIHPEQS